MPEKLRTPPSLSLLVPLRDEARHLDRFLASLRTLRYEAAPVEVLLAEGASRDDTRTRLEAALPGLRAARPAWSFTLVDNPGGSIPAGLNRALRASRGRVLFRLDAHTLFPDDYLERCVETLERTGADNVGGVVVAVPGAETPTARAIARARSDLFGAGGSSFRTGFSSGTRRTVPFGCFPRATFERFGLFDERLLRNQDIEFNHRIRKGGGRVHQEGNIVARYLAPSGYSSLLRKHFANGRWNVFATAVGPGCLGPTHAVPGLFLLGVGAAALVHPVLAAALLALLLLADLARAAWIGRKRGVLRLGFAFAAIQLAHGLGQWAGLLGLPWFWRRPRPDRRLEPASGGARRNGS